MINKTATIQELTVQLYENEIQDEILALEVGQSIPFKIRDDKDSVGSVTRLK